MPLDRNGVLPRTGPQQPGCTVSALSAHEHEVGPGLVAAGWAGRRGGHGLELRSAERRGGVAAALAEPMSVEAPHEVGRAGVADRAKRD